MTSASQKSTLDNYSAHNTCVHSHRKTNNKIECILQIMHVCVVCVNK
jgi:hypothetical protein